MLRRVIGTLILMTWAGVAGAQFVGPGGAVPILANNPGLAGTLWRSDVYLTNVSDQPASVILVLLPEIVGGEAAFEPMTSDEILLPANGQVTLANVLQSSFGLTNVKGALQVISSSGTPVLVSSRVYNVLDDGGSFGQDAQALVVAERAYAGGVEHDGFFRTNLGIFLPVTPSPSEPILFDVTVRTADGSVAGAGQVEFGEAGVVQLSLSDFSVGLLVDGWIEVECSDTDLTWFAYISRVDQITGDAVFRPLRASAASLP